MKAKPNPAGKDRSRYGTTTPTQLAAEWVDFQNTGHTEVVLGRVVLYHLTASERGERKWEKVMGFKGSLRAGQVVRVHSGQVRPLSVIAAEDLAGADCHLFTGSDRYVWNNAEGDCPALWDSSIDKWIDKACYDPNPPEGVVLARSGDKLVAPARVASRARGVR